MKSSVRCHLATLIFLLRLLFTLADYCQSSNCCAYNRYAEKACRGSGTSPITDFLASNTRNSSTYIVGGVSRGIFFVGSFYYQWQEGFEANGYVLTTYGYVIQFPASARSREVFYFVSVLDCPRIFELTPSTPGEVPTTDLRYNYIYTVCRGFEDTYYPGPCTVLDGTSIPFYGSDFNALNQRNVLFMSALRALRVKPTERRELSAGLQELARKYALSYTTERGSRSYLFTARGSSWANNCNTNPNTNGVPFGQWFVDNGYNTTNVYGDNLCDLSTTFSRYSASQSSPSVSWLKFVFLVSPFHLQYELNILIPNEGIRPFFRGFFSVC